MGFLDNTGLAHLWQHINILIDNKVDKVSGKSLIADSEITRLASVKTGLEIDLTEEELEEGIFLVNADQLNGKDASAYALKNEVVTSINGQTGDVTITQNNESVDTSKFYSNTNPPPYPVVSVNGQEGTVVLTAKDINALPSDFDGFVTSVNGQTGDVIIETTGGSNSVTSVNGQVGNVTLTASDVNALPDTYKAVTSLDGNTGALTLVKTVAWNGQANIVKGLNLVTGIPLSMTLDANASNSIIIGCGSMISFCSALVKSDTYDFTATVSHRNNSGLAIVIRNNSSSSVTGSGTISLFILASAAGQLYIPD